MISKIRTIRKTAIFSAIASVLIVGIGCSRDETTTEFPDGKYSLCAQLQSSTRTSLQDETSAGAKVVWSADDALFISDGQQSGQYVLYTGENTASGRFAGDVEFQKDIYAYYPYAADVALTGSEMSAVLPSVLSYAQASFATNTAPMAAAAAVGDDLVFDNLCAVLKLQYKGTERISKIVVRSAAVTDDTGTNDALPVCGSATITFIDGKPALAISGNEGYSLTLSAGNDGETLDPNDAKGFYFVLPAGTYPRLVIELYDPENGLTTTKRLSGKTLKAGTILEINPFNYNSSVWDGASEQEVTAVNGTYTVNTAAELAWLSSAVAAGNSFGGKTVKLAGNIDLDNKEWTPIGGKTLFRGTFDGGNNTISNLKVSGTGTTDDNSKGLFGGTAGATFRNITIENANVTGSEYVGALVATNYEGVFENCRVINSKITGSTSTGALIGRIAEAKVHLQIRGCAVENCEIVILNNTAFGSADDVAGKKVGGIVGAVASYVDTGSATPPILTFADCTVDGLKVNSLSGTSIGVNDVVGQLDNLTTLTTNVEFTNITVANGTGYRTETPYLAYIGSLRVAANPVHIMVDGTAVLCGNNASPSCSGEYVINDNVETVSVSVPDVTIVVPEGIEYPALTIAKNTTGLTIEGNYKPTSRKRGKAALTDGVTYMKYPIKGSDGTDKFTIRNVAFDVPAENYLTNNYALIDFYYLNKISNVTVENCYSRNTLKPFVQIGVDQGPSVNTAANNITIHNNMVEFSTAAASNINGIFLTYPSGKCIIEGNTITAAKYHGIFISGSTAETYILNNTIVDPGQDGIKMDLNKSVVSITGNKVRALHYGIRLPRINHAATNITISENSLCLTKQSSTWSGIYLASGTSNMVLDNKIVVKDNDFTADAGGFAFSKQYNVGGTILSEVDIDGAYSIFSTTHLKHFRDLVNHGEILQNRVFKLYNNISLSKTETWTPIGDAATGHSFTGIFDGGGYSVKNVTLGSGSCQGFFGSVSNSTIKNLTIEGVALTSDQECNAVGGVAGEASSNLTLDNISVKTIAYDVRLSDSYGGLIGRIRQGNRISINNCHVSAATMNIAQNAGGLIGSCTDRGNSADLSISISGSSVDGLTMTACSENTNAHCGALFGQFAPAAGVDRAASLTVSGCSVANTTITGIVSDAGTTPDVTPYDKYLGYYGQQPLSTYTNTDL